MSLPVLDKENYQHVCSDWVLRAGQALRQAGYLQSDPTGTYDEEFDAALRAFQSDQGIYEEDYVGAMTWAALGIADEPAAETAGMSVADAAEVSVAETAVGQVSEDGQWKWDGSEWVPVPASDQVCELSEDGLWQWNGAEWLPVSGTQPAAAVTVAADPGLEVFTNGKRYIIFEDEVRSDGTIAWRARNPGNIRSGEKYGAYPGKKANTKSVGSFAVFPDEATGFEAIKLVLKGYSALTVLATMKKYAPESDGNDPVSYAKKVAKEMDVSIETKVGSLDDGQLETFAEAIKTVEGWKEGTTYSLDDPSLPEAVKKGIRGQ